MEHAHHAAAHRVLAGLLARGDRVAVVPQVLTEFVHVVTDARRFQTPLPMESALDRSEFWWNAAEVEQIVPGEAAVARFHDWMRQHRLAHQTLTDAW